MLPVGAAITTSYTCVISTIGQSIHSNTYNNTNDGTYCGTDYRDRRSYYGTCCHSGCCNSSSDSRSGICSGDTAGDS